MKFEHWYSRQFNCWFICNAENGELLEMQSAAHLAAKPISDGWHAIEYLTEEALLSQFPTSVNISDKMGD